MKFNMLENSMDSLSEAIDYYINGKNYKDERCYKFCVLMLYHSAELILKEILVREHKTLIFERIKDYKSGSDIKTIGFVEALSRVKTICEIDFGQYYNYLENMASMRNKFQHYEVNIDPDTLINIIINSFSSIEYLVYSVLKTNFNDYENIISISQIEELHFDEEAYMNRKNDLNNEIITKNLDKIKFEYKKDKYINVPCPKCSETFVVHDDSSGLRCLFCGENYCDINELYKSDRNCNISNYMERELGKRRQSVDNLYECIDCNYNTLIFNDEKSVWMCAACGKSFDKGEVRQYHYFRGEEDWEADLADMMEDSHYSHLLK